MTETVPLVSESEHFRIQVLPHSFAEQNLPLVRGQLEALFARLMRLLDMRSPFTQKIDVILADLLADPAQPDTPLTSGSYVTAGKLELRVVYRTDSPGEQLERAVVQLVLTSQLGNQLPAPLLVVGLATLLTYGQEDGSIDGAIADALITAQQEHRLPRLPALVANPPAETQPGYRPTAAGFVSYLLLGYGPERFGRLLAASIDQPFDRAIKDVYATDLAQLERRWRKTIPSGAPAGVGSFLRLAVTYLRPYWRRVIEIVLYVSVGVAFAIGLAKAQGYLIDLALIPRDIGALAVIMTVIIVTFVIASLASVRESYLTAFVAESVMKELRTGLFANIQRLHPGFFQVFSTGDILSRVTSDLGAIQFAMTGALVQSFQILLTLALAILFIVLEDWRLALLGLAATPLFWVINRYIGPAVARASRTQQDRLGVTTNTIQENLGAQTIIKAFGLQDRAIRDYRRNLDDLFQSSLRLTYLSQIYGLAVNSLASGIQLAVIGVGSWLVIGGNLTTGALFAFLALMAQIIGPVQSISGIVQSLQRASGALQRVEELLHARPAIQDAPRAAPLPHLGKEIRLEDVTFGYRDDNPVLRGLHLTIPAGQNVALLGPSGCGKSTILGLLLRFYDPQHGRVTLDGVDLKDGTLESLRDQIGIVFQDNVLFNLSFRENIRLGNVQATDAEVESAAKAAEIHDIIMGMPDGYDTIVGERGGRLSGGQRQRVAIARALVRNPSVLLLDEATSALDPRTEAAINATLEQIARGRTTISVTHRLSSAVAADQIYVLDQGMLVEQGTHDELLELNGLYARLWQQQNGFAAASGQAAGIEITRLQRVPLFAGLKGDVLAAFARHLSTERIPAGGVIFQKGDAGDKLYVIQRGEVDVLMPDAAGRDQSIAVLREGDYFGEMALLFDTPRSATIQARTAVLLISLDRDDFQDLLAAAPVLRARIDEVVASRMLAAGGATASETPA